MKVLKSWLQEYLASPLPETSVCADALTLNALEVKGIETSGDDVVLDVDVLPNRSHDCLSHLGIAREISVLLTIPFVPPSFEFEGARDVSSAEQLTLTVNPDTRVVRAMKRLAVDVTVGPSPDWLKKKLEALGQRSINNIVDITNFVMLETGQPVHAFDFDKLAGNGQKHITIRKAHEGEVITVLDGKTFTLANEMVVIADDDKALDIAGIKGGAASGIDEHTTRVVLSACTFNPTQIRKTSRALNLMTDASKRFEQGVSPILAERAMARLSQLVTELAGGKVSGDVLDVYPRRRNPFVIGVSTQDVNRILGTQMNDADIEAILTRLGFAFEKVTPVQKALSLAESFVGVPYQYGASVSYDAPRVFDCSSFVNFVYAQAGIASPRMTMDQYVFFEPVEEDRIQPGDLVFANHGGDGTTEYIETLGVSQVRTTTVSQEFFPGTKLPQSADHNGIYLGDGKIIHASGKWHRGEVLVENLSESVSFKNIVGYRRVSRSSEERYVVTIPEERLDLQSGPGFMISGNTEDLVEEIGRVYGYDKIAPVIPESSKQPEFNKTFYYTQKIRDILVDLGFSEVMTYSFVEKGNVEVANPIAEDKKYLRAGLSGELTKTFERNNHEKPFLGLSAVNLFEIGTVFEKDSEHLELAVLSEKQQRVDEAFTEIETNLEKRLEHKNGVVNLTAYIASLLELASYDDLAPIDTAGKLFSPLSPFPFVLRDIAVWTPNPVTSVDVEKLLREESGTLLVRITQFDAFTKDGRTSYAYHLVFQSHEKTLSDDEVNTVMDRVTKTLNARDGWQVR